MRLIFAVLVTVFLASCGSDKDCPSGVNNSHPNCPNYVGQYPYQSPQPYCQPGQPNCNYNNGYNNGYPCQQGTPNCVNGYYQYPGQYPYNGGYQGGYQQCNPCQQGTQGCYYVNGQYCRY